MQWAAEHKEPIYPTWFEYLYAISNPDYFDLTEFYTWMRHTPIPADIAQKLRIKPKDCPLESFSRPHENGKNETAQNNLELEANILLRKMMGIEPKEDI